MFVQLSRVIAAFNSIVFDQLLQEVEVLDL